LNHRDTEAQRRIQDLARKERWTLLKRSSYWTLAIALGLQFAAAAQAPPKVGEPAPEIVVEKWLECPDGREVSWKALQGKAFVLEFWAAWCGPCVMSIPHMNALVDKYKDKPVRFLAVTNDKEARVLGLLQKKPMKACVGFDTDDSAFRAYGVRSIPRAVLVDAKGRVAALTHPALISEQVLDDLIAGKPVGSSAQAQAGAALEAGREPGDTGPAPLFEVVVRPTEDVNGAFSAGEGLLLSHAVPLELATGLAYGVRPTRVKPEFELNAKRYTIVVRTPEGRKEMLEPLLRQALESSFSFAAVADTREVEAYVLSAPEAASVKFKRHAQGQAAYRYGPTGFSASGHGLERLAEDLEQFLGRPVLDETGLKDRYDWDVSCDLKKPEAVIAAVRDQLGLQLTPATRPVEFLALRKTPPPAKPAQP
jgi:uncharacterized protein (TIGR03435 family)